MPMINKISLIEIDGVRFTKKYLEAMLPTIESLARVYIEHSDKISNTDVLELEDPHTGGCYSIWWNELEQFAIELPPLLT